VACSGQHIHVLAFAWFEGMLNAFEKASKLTQGRSFERFKDIQYVFEEASALTQLSYGRVIGKSFLGPHSSRSRAS